MIYTVIAFLGENRIEKNRDCREFRQPLSLLPEEIKKYIENTKNEAVRAERELTYITLLCSLKAFFDIDKIRLERAPDGKPYLKDSNIHFNLSHSDGVIAACISDEGEVGVDLQSDIAPERAERLKDRFFKDFEPESESLDANYYFCCIDGAEAVFKEINPALPCLDSFSTKWSAAESLMKLHGRGFADASVLPLLAKTSKTEVRKITADRDYYLAVSIEK